MSFENLHNDIYNKFLDLSHNTNDQSRKIYFIEHGFSQSQLSNLVTVTKQFLHRHNIEDELWDRHYLPIIIIATEVGYKYRGTGTDFWPLLEAELSTQLNPVNRQRIQRFFSTASRVFRGAEPPETRWSSAFRLISWPITHALLPLEFHRSFAQILAQLGYLRDTSDEDIYRSIVNTQIATTGRFKAFLSNRDLIIRLTRSLMTPHLPEHTGFSHEVIARLNADLLADDVARLNITAARTNQNRAPMVNRVPQLNPAQQGPVVGKLSMRRLGNSYVFEGHFTGLDEQLTARARRAARQIRYAPKLWGIVRVPFDQILSGLPFNLVLPIIPNPEDPFLPDVHTAGFDTDIADYIAQFQLTITVPALLAVSSTGDVGRRIVGNNITANRRYWYVCENNIEAPGVPRLGTVGPCNCLDIDLACPQSLDFIELHGYSVQDFIPVRFGGAPFVSRDASKITFVTGDKCVFGTERNNLEEISYTLNGEVANCIPTDLCVFEVSEAEQIINVANAEHSYVINSIRIPNQYISPCSVIINSTELTTQALLGGRISFTVESKLPLYGLDISVSLIINGETYSATGIAAVLPVIISADHHILQCLLDEQIRRLLMIHTTATIRIDLGNLVTCEWTLERKISQVWWDIDNEGRPKLLTEDGEVTTGYVSESTPYSAPNPESNEGDLDSEVYLLTPLPSSILDCDNPDLFTTLCLVPRSVSLDSRVVIPDRILRQRKSLARTPGLEDLVAGYLRWTLAESQSSAADLKRRQVAMHLEYLITAAICGEKWILLERESPKVSHWDCFLAVLGKTEVGRDTYIDLESEVEHDLRIATIEHLQQLVPDFWNQIRLPVNLTNSDHELLESSVLSAYETLAERAVLSGNEELSEMLSEADPYTQLSEWESAIESAIEKYVVDIEQRRLAELVTPTHLVHKLVARDYQHLSSSEVIDLLWTWVEQASDDRALTGPCPTLDSIRALYYLWIDPGAVITMDWKGALDVALINVGLARAVRYVVLRSRRVSMGI